eukprot:COSAG04_NODE_28708_length_274_cov_0.571429_1_plen_36_part_01
MQRVARLRLLQQPLHSVSHSLAGHSVQRGKGVLTKR